jgi:hypothetical protein
MEISSTWIPVMCKPVRTKAESRYDVIGSFPVSLHISVIGSNYLPLMAIKWARNTNALANFEFIPNSLF